MNVFDLFAKISLDTSGYTSGIGKVLSGASKVAAGVGGAMVAVTTATTGAAVAFGKESLEVGKEFDSAMSQVAATLGVTVDQVDDLRAKAKEMGATTNFSATQAAEGLNILAMSGFDAQQAMAMIPDVLHLSGAGAIGMGEAAAYVSGAIKGFSDSAENATYYANLMAKGATLANTSVGQLGEAISGSAASAAAYKQSADSMTVSLLRLAEQGEVGSAAATALAAAQKNLYTPTDQAKEALDALGVAAYDEAGNARDFNVVIDELTAALSGMTDAQRSAYKQTIFGIQGLSAYNKMSVTTTDRTQEWAAALREAQEGAGEAAAQYNTMTDNLQGDLDILSSSMDALKIAVSENLTGSAREFVRFGSSALTSLSEGFSEGGIAGAAAKLGEIIPQGITLMLEKAPEAVNAITSIMNSLGGALEENAPAIVEAFGNLLVNSAPLLARSSLGLLKTFVRMIGDNLPKTIGFISSFVSELGEIIVENLDVLDTDIPKIVEALAQGISENAPILIPKIIEVLLKIIDALTNPDAVTMITGAALDIILGFVGGIIEALPVILENAPLIIDNLIQGIAQTLPMIINAAIMLIGALAKAMYDPELLLLIVEAAAGIILSLVKGLGTFVLQIPGIVLTWIETLVDVFGGNAEKLIKSGKDLIEKFGDGIMSKLKDVGKWGEDLIKNFVGGITEKWNTLKSKVTDIAGTIKDFLGFSEPKKGPLSNFHTYAPDMMKLFADGIDRNGYLVTDAMERNFGAPDMRLDASSAVSTAQKEVTVVLELDKTELGRTVFSLNKDETRKRGMVLINA